MIPHVPHGIPYNSGDPRFDDTDLYDDKVIVLSTLGQGPRGENGDSFEFEDFTKEQLAELRADVATVYCRKLEATYNTVGEETTTIEIPFEDYSSKDMLFVDVEGLALTEGTDYTIDGTSIVLTQPITHHYTAVNFRLLTIIAMSTQDFNDLIGDISDDIAAEVDAWLTAHPETTTMIQDNSIILRKLGVHIEHVVTDGDLVIQLVDNQENH